MISSLQSVQNTAARIVTLTKKFDHITPVLIQLHWLPAHFRIFFKVLFLVYKALNCMAPLYITELSYMFTYVTLYRSKTSGSSEIKTTYANSVFSVAAPKLWKLTGALLVVTTNTTILNKS